MRKLLVIAAEQEALGAAPGPHTLMREHVETLRRAAAPDIEVVVATPEAAREHYGEAEIVASFPARMPDIAELPEARWLHSFSAGMDRILTPAVAASRVLLSNSRGAHAVPIAEHILGFMLIFSRGFTDTFRNQEKHAWKKAGVLGEIYGSTVLVVGLGEIGSRAARLAHALGARVLAVVRTARRAPEHIEYLGTTGELDSPLPPPRPPPPPPPPNNPSNAPANAPYAVGGF